MTLDIPKIIKMGLTVRQYLDLMWLFHNKEGGQQEFVLNYGGVSYVDAVDYAALKYIKITAGKLARVDEDYEYELRNKIRDLFEGEKDLFYTWLSNFPIKTPTGRRLSVKDPDSKAAKALKKKWTKHFKNDPAGAQKAIDVLNAEMAWRRKTGKFEYMHNAETWLNQFDYEQYEYLLDEHSKMDSKTKEDFT